MADPPLGWRQAPACHDGKVNSASRRWTFHPREGSPSSAARPENAAICAAFHWVPGTCDDEFLRLNTAIEAVALATPGEAGVESRPSPDGSRRCANDGWRDFQALAAFARDPGHAGTKRQRARWHEGVHIVIAQVVHTCGAGRLPHRTPDERAASRELRG